MLGSFFLFPTRRENAELEGATVKRHTDRKLIALFVGRNLEL